jgi:D-glycero-alpha-D-manno-heptose-7-phosphate kinase
MIISRTPFRISFAGGGTDLPEFYRRGGGAVTSATINKYMYLTVNRAFDHRIRVAYSQTEIVEHADQVHHPLVREALKLVGITEGVEITSIADIPAQTGLGSSSSFTVGLLNALYAFKGEHVGADRLAREACHIEIDLAGEPIGKQDQYIAAFGGVTCFRFNRDDKVEAWPLKLNNETLYNLEDNLLLFFTGYSRSASSILRQQDSQTKERNADMIENLHYVKDLGLRSLEALEGGRLGDFGRLMDEHWQHKKRRSSAMSNPKIDEWYDLAIKNGAGGGKLIGAGGGGFLMFYAEDKMRLRHTMTEAGLTEVRFRFDFEGTKTIVQ